MSSTPYGQLKDEEMILRDHLAIDRTALANERTFLAYVRTALAAGGAGAVLIHFFEAWPVRILGVVLVAAVLGEHPGQVVRRRGEARVERQPLLVTSRRDTSVALAGSRFAR